MTTLTETARVARIAIKAGGLVLVVMIVGRFMVDIGVKYWKAAHPPAPLPPTMAFGVMPEVNFPQRLPITLTYTQQLPSGKWPTFSDRTEVYLMPEKRPRFLANEATMADAAALGFKEKPEKISETTFRFLRGQPLTTTLEMNIYTGKFNYMVDWLSDPNYLLVKKLPSDTQAVDEVKVFLKKANLIPDDLIKGEVQITYLKTSGGSYKKTVSLSEADFINVDIYRAKIGGNLTVVTPDPEQGVVRGTVSGNPSGGRIVKLEYNYYAVDYNSKATYPLKSAEQAWSDLTEGKGYLARLDPGVTEAIIRRMELSYYDTYEPQPYLQPVYVFRGDDNLVAYVPALLTTSGETSSR